MRKPKEEKPQLTLEEISKKEILSIDEAAMFLGLSTTTMYRRVQKEEVPGFRIGRFWKFNREALAKWSARQMNIHKKASA